MHVVAFCGSGRKQGNTYLLLKAVFEPLAASGVETEIIELAGNEIRGCMSCYICFLEKNGTCVLKKDIVNDCIVKMKAADAILLGSPAYFGDVSSEMKALIDRSGMVSQANGHIYKRKPGAAVVAVRRFGALHSLGTMNHFFLLNQMIIVGSTSCSVGIGTEKGEVLEDDEGMKNMRLLGENILWLLNKLHV